MMLLRLLSWPYARRHATRILLTLLAIVFGIAVFMAMHTANAAVFGTFQETINRIAGATQLQVTAGDAGFDEEVLERVQSLPQVRVAAPIIEAVVGTGLVGQGNLLVLGVDMTGDRSLREYDLAAGDEAILDDPLVFLAQPDSIMISAEFADRNGFRLNSRVPLDTIDGRKEFTVRGILKSSGLTSAFGGNLAIMDIYAAQFAFGRGRRFDRIDLAVGRGVEVGDAQQALQSLLGVGYEVERPATRGQQFQSILRIYRFMLNFSSGFALVVGMFIIFNAFSTAVTQRRGEIGLLRALGATRRQIGMLFLGESVLLALVGSVLGVAAGQLAAGVVARTTAALVQDAYGVGGAAVDVAFAPAVAILAIAAGLGTSALAAVLPARNAARVDPVKALQKGRNQVLGEGVTRGRTMVAAVLAVSGALLLAGDSLSMFYVSYACVLVAALLLTPESALWLTRAIRPLLRWLRPVEGALAADSLIAAPKRTSSTVAALMLSLALVIGLAGTALGFYGQVTDWVTTYLNPDLFVSSSPTLTGRTYRFPDEMTAQLAAIEGIDEVHRLRHPRIQVGAGQVLLIAVEVDKTIRRSPMRVVAGDEREMFRLAAAGQGIIASEGFASMRKAQLGDVIELPSPSGAVSLPLVGVIKEYSDQQGALLIDLALFRRYWRDDSVNFFRVYLEPGARAESVKARILTAFADNRRIFVLTNADVRDYVSGLTDQWFRMTWGQVAIAILVAALGIVNSLTVSITDRRRELGVLRAVGGFPSQIRWTIWMEAIAVGAVSVILGVVLGGINLYYQLEMTARDFPGLRLDYQYPSGMAAALFPIILITAVAGATLPAEAAVRGSLVEALEYE